METLHDSTTNGQSGTLFSADAFLIPEFYTLAAFLTFCYHYMVTTQYATGYVS